MTILKPTAGPVAVILVHGFTGSPSQMSWLAASLEAQGCSTIIPCLAGHNSYPEDLLNHTCEDWILQVKHAVRDAVARYPHVFIAGLSLGGALALTVAASEPCCGVITMAAPYRLPLWQELLATTLHPVRRWRDKPDGPDIKNKAAAAAMRSYTRYPLRATVEVFRLLRHFRRIAGRIDLPVLIMHGREDHAVPFRNAELLCDALPSGRKRFVALENSYHILTLDYDRELVRDEIVRFCYQVISEKQGPLLSRSA